MRSSWSSTFIKGGTFGANEVAILGVGCVVAFVVSLIAIKWLMGFVRRHDFKCFGVYRIILGIVVLAYFFVSGAYARPVAWLTLRGGQSDNLSFKEGGMTKRSMPPSFHANLFVLAAARCRCCHDIGGFVIVNRSVQVT